MRVGSECAQHFGTRLTQNLGIQHFVRHICASGWRDSGQTWQEHGQCDPSRASAEVAQDVVGVGLHSIGGLIGKGLKSTNLWWASAEVGPIATTPEFTTLGAASAEVGPMLTKCPNEPNLGQPRPKLAPAFHKQCGRLRPDIHHVWFGMEQIGRFWPRIVPTSTDSGAEPTDPWRRNAAVSGRTLRVSSAAVPRSRRCFGVAGLRRMSSLCQRSAGRDTSAGRGLVRRGASREARLPVGGRGVERRPSRGARAALATEWEKTAPGSCIQSRILRLRRRRYDRGGNEPR